MLLARIFQKSKYYLPQNEADICKWRKLKRKRKRGKANMEKRGKRRRILKPAFILSLCAVLAGTPVFSYTAAAAGTVLSEANNLTQSADMTVTASANSYESETAFTADKAIDGSVDRDGSRASRWASNVQQNEEKWLAVQFSEAVPVRTVVIEWERRNATRYEIRYEF